MSFEREPRPIVAAERKPNRDWAHQRDISLTVLAWLIIVSFLLWVAGHVIGTLIVLAIAVLLAYGLSPLVNAVARVLPRVLAITIVYLAFFATLSGLLYLIIDTAVRQVVPLAQYLQSLLGTNNPQLQDLLNKVGISPDQLSNLGQQVLAQARNIAGALLPLVGDFASVMIDIVVITVLSVYFVANAPRMDRWVRTSAPLDHRDRVTFVVDTLNRVLGGYIRGQVTLALLVGLLVGIGMQVLQVPYAVLLGVLAFVLEFIPFLGVLVSGVACVLVGLTVGPITALLVLAYFVVIHVIEADFVGPRIVGNAVGLHPAISLIALVTGAELFGVWGALFAAPVAGILQALSISIWRTWRREHSDQFPGGHPPSVDGEPPSVPITPMIPTEMTPAP
ncbi:MAG: AI-2E family transporter [Ktedonobacterales bacterium]|nr:AI-2E family transporter [Ktedonobacterales bacterium]